MIEWPPRVWHGVIDPVTGEKIPPTRLGGLEHVKERMDSRSELAQKMYQNGKETADLPD